MTSPDTPGDPVAVQVIEPPAERLRRLSIAPDVPKADLWRAIAEAVIDINERIAALEAQAAVRRANYPEGRTLMPETRKPTAEVTTNTTDASHCPHTVIEYDERGRGTCRLCWQPMPLTMDEQCAKDDAASNNGAQGNE